MAPVGLLLGMFLWWTGEVVFAVSSWVEGRFLGVFPWHSLAFFVVFLPEIEGSFSFLVLASVLVGLGLQNPSCSTTMCL